MNKDIIMAVLKSPVCMAILSLYFVSQVLTSVVVPIVHVVTDTIPAKMETLISELRDMKQSCLGDRVANVPKGGHLNEGR